MMTKFTFATQPRYDRTHGNITYSADSQPSRFSFNIRIVALYIKTHTEFQFTVRFNFQRVHVNLSIYIYIVTIVAKILKRTESRSSQNQSLFLTHPVHALFLFFSFFRFFSSTVLLFFVFFLSFFFSLLAFHLSSTGQREEGRQSQEVGLVKWDRDLENPEWPTLEVAIRSPRERRTISSLLSLLHWFGSSFLSLSLFRSFNFPSFVQLLYNVVFDSLLFSYAIFRLLLCILLCTVRRFLFLVTIFTCNGSFLFLTA